MNFLKICLKLLYIRDSNVRKYFIFNRRSLIVWTDIVRKLLSLFNLFDAYFFWLFRYHCVGFGEKFDKVFIPLFISEVKSHLLKYVVFFNFFMSLFIFVLYFFLYLDFKFIFCDEFGFVPFWYVFLLFSFDWKVV